MFLLNFLRIVWQGTLIGLAAFSEGELVNMLRSAAMLCPIAYLGQVTSPLARSGAENLLAEVNFIFECFYLVIRLLVMLQSNRLYFFLYTDFVLVEYS